MSPYIFYQQNTYPGKISSITNRDGAEATPRIYSPGGFRSESGDEMIALVSVVTGEDNRPSTVTVREVNVDSIDKDMEAKSMSEFSRVTHLFLLKSSLDGDVRSASQSDLYTLSDRASNFFGTFDPNYDSQSEMLGTYMPVRN